MKRILSKVIFENQSAFVPGKSITDNVLIAFEVLRHLKRKNSGNEGEVALKLDVSKGCDRVSWSYMKRRMQEMGFAEKWIKWVMLCASTVMYFICFNGDNVRPIIPR